MKKLLFILLAISFTAYATAQDKESDLKQLLELMKVEETIDGKVNSMIPMLKQQVGLQLKGDNAEEKLNQYIDFMMEEVKELSKKLANEEMINIYDKHFTHKEVKDLIKFYKSPTGQKILAVSPEISKDMMNAMTTKYLPDFQDRLMKKLEELKQ